jgi:transcriptional regulator with XRE-family HTH domain
MTEPDDLSREIGQLIRTVRQRQGMTLFTLAALLDTSPARLSRIERGGPVTLHMLSRIAHVLQVPVDALLPPELLQEAARAAEDLTSPAALCTRLSALLAQMQVLIARLCEPYLEQP